MVAIHLQKKRKSQDPSKMKPSFGRSLRRNWLKRLSKSKDKALRHDVEDGSNPNSIAVPDGRIGGEIEREAFQTPSPLIKVDSTRGRAGPKRKKEDYEKITHLLPSSSTSLTQICTPESTEEQSDQFYTCPSSPIMEFTTNLSLLPTTPTKVTGVAGKKRRHRPQTLVKRMEANYQLRRAYKGHATPGSMEGFLAEPIPISFPCRQSPEMSKTEFERYLERALSKEIASSNGNETKGKEKIMCNEIW